MLFSADPALPSPAGSAGELPAADMLLHSCKLLGHLLAVCKQPGTHAAPSQSMLLGPTRYMRVTHWGVSSGPPLLLGPVLLA